MHVDQETAWHQVLYTYPITKRDYLLGRFLGNLLVCFFILLGMGVALWLASGMPFLEPGRLGPNQTSCWRTCSPTW